MAAMPGSHRTITSSPLVSKRTCMHSGMLCDCGTGIALCDCGIGLVGLLRRRPAPSPDPRGPPSCVPVWAPALPSALQLARAQITTPCKVSHRFHLSAIGSVCVPAAGSFCVPPIGSLFPATQDAAHITLLLLQT